MTIDNKLRNEKLQYNINRESAKQQQKQKKSALLSGKIDKYEHLEGEEILPSCRGQTIEQAMFTYSPLVKALEKQVICKILLKKKI